MDTINTNFVDVLDEAYISIDEHDNVVIRSRKIDNEFLDWWNGLSNKEQFNILGKRFSSVHSVKIN